MIFVSIYYIPWISHPQMFPESSSSLIIFHLKTEGETSKYCSMTYEMPQNKKLYQHNQTEVRTCI